jgi:hypothetical protein
VGSQYFLTTRSSFYVHKRQGGEIQVLQPHIGGRAAKSRHVDGCYCFLSPTKFVGGDANIQFALIMYIPANNRNVYY